MANENNEQELDLNNLPEKAPQKWRNICEATIKVHDEDLTPKEIDVICDYTWDLFRDTIKLSKSANKDTSTNQNEDNKNG